MVASLKKMSVFQPPEPVNATLFGKRIFKDVMKLGIDQRLNWPVEKRRDIANGGEEKVRVSTLACWLPGLRAGWDKVPRGFMSYLPTSYPLSHYVLLL